MRWFARTTTAAGILMAALACRTDPAGPGLNPEAAQVTTGSFYAGNFSFILTDPESHLLMAARYNDGFCPTTGQFTESAETDFREVAQIDEAIRLFTGGEVWLYIYDWHGEVVNCSFLRNHTPLATGMGVETFMDNDFYPFPPYEPGPGTNVFYEHLHGPQLTTPSGGQAEFLGVERLMADRFGNLVKADVKLQLSPDPRN